MTPLWRGGVSLPFFPLITLWGWGGGDFSLVAHHPLLSGDNDWLVGIPQNGGGREFKHEIGVKIVQPT